MAETEAKSEEDQAIEAARLDEDEREEVEERRQVPARLVYETIRLEGEEELRRPAMSLAFSGLAAGLSMGFSLVALGLLHAMLPDEPWRPLVMNLGYTVGFLIVIMGRQQLFTENTLTPVLPLLNAPTARNFLRVLRLWAIVLAANIAGAIVFAYVVTHFAIVKPEIAQAFAQIGHAGCCETGFGTVVARSIFAGWLIALMVWLLPAADNARAMIIVIVTYLVGLAGFNHVIAGSVEVLFNVMRGEVSWSSYLFAFFVPTLIGNVLGGLILVAALNFGQVAAEKKSG